MIKLTQRMARRVKKSCKLVLAHGVHLSPQMTLHRLPKRCGQPYKVALSMLLACTQTGPIAVAH
jgi:hypothetical protein